MNSFLWKQNCTYTYVQENVLMGTCQNVIRDHPWRGMGKVRNTISVFNTCFTAKFKKK